jgi:mannose-6-phosphate isomerase-like protein (cupin superfamily)
MKGYKNNIERDTKKNKVFRNVVYTGHHLQLVLMSLKPGEDIGAEVHKDTDQFFRVDRGTGKCIIDKKTYLLKDGDAVIVPAGAKHNIINTHKTKSLKLYTIYAPPHHKDGTIHQTKEIAENSEEDFDGVTSE